MRTLIFSLLIFLFALFATALAPFRGAALAWADDPFFYLHQDIILPLFHPWIGAESNVTANFYNTPAHEVNLPSTYDGMEAKFHQRKRVLSSKASVENGKLGSGCENIIIARKDSSSMSIQADALQRVDGGQCRYKIEAAAFSDDETKIAVQLGDWSKENMRYIRIFEMSGNTAVPLHSLRGRMRLPAAFAYDGGVLYAPSDILRSYFNSCLVRKWLNGRDSCEIWRNDLPASKREMALSMYRGVGGQSSWVILSNIRHGRGSVYQWENAPDGMRLTATGVDNVSRLAATPTGFFYVREAVIRAPAEGNELQFFFLDLSGRSRSIFSAPISGTKWTRNGDGLLVWIRGDGKAPNQLFRIGQREVKQLPLSAHLQFVSDVEFIGTSHLGEIRLRVSDETGELSYGSVSARGAYAEHFALRYPFSIDVGYFVGRSQDGVEIPCSIIKKAGVKEPTPAIVEVYGAYGEIIRPIAGSLDAAILERNIAIVYAHARGGGELGTVWENGGKGRNKINTIHDTEACIGAAIQSRKIVDGNILLRGTSAGGVPAMMVALRNPGRVKGAWLDVPYLDSAGLHHNDSASDAEFGTVADVKEGLERLKISPYQTLLTPSRATGSYLLGCGEHDVRVPKWHCMKVHMAIKEFHPNMRSHLFIMKERGHLMPKPGATADREYGLIALRFVLATLH
jgi:hypothetical protein